MGDRTHPAANLAAGGVAGVCRRLVQQPFDTIKVRMQSTALGRDAQFRNSFDCFYQTAKREGVRGLYRGLSVMILMDAPLSAIYFFGVSIGKRLQRTGEGKEPRIYESFLAGCLGSTMTSVIVVPAERIKILLQVEQAKHFSPVHVGKQLWESGGLRSFYRGALATLCRDLPSGGIYLAVYEWIRRYLLAMTSNLSQDRLALGPTILAGGFAGLVASAVGMPPDVIKSRLQSAPDHAYPIGMRYVFQELLQKGGIGAFYRGFTPIALYAFPGSAACMLGYELAIDIWLELRQN